MEIAGYISAVLIGLSLGLIGGGGSALAVPVLVYFFGLPMSRAIPDSLFIVGLTSFVGALGYIRNKLISYKSVLFFGLPSVISVFVTRKFIFPAIPAHIPLFGGPGLSKDIFFLILFSILMLGASYSMIRPRKVLSVEAEVPAPFNHMLIILGGLLVGFLAGLVGAGGGFLIIPALVLLAGLPMKRAIGTSLLIISVNSFIGFLGDVNNNALIDWSFLGLFSIMSVSGIFIGMYVSKFISGATLKPAFGWFILAVGTYIISQQILKIY